ncbi:hypothetical protein LCGC14_1980960 [marine sediment metagenome]|uniref:Aminoglycoside phosphotransferase domain-containing protein n=1 Tax=marine sediment metagenome TaxID=412755 RepID=A0A0F9HM77_9ZZZZ
MTAEVTNGFEHLLAWCVSELGPVEEASDHSKSHTGDPVVTCRLRAASGYCYLKTHRDPSYWEAEVHAYEQWSVAFGDFAPRLLAVRGQEPLALVVSELAGECLENVQLPPPQERAVWRAAGQAVARLHDLAVGDYFGPCHRDGAPAGDAIRDAREYMTAELEDVADRGRGMGYLSDADLAVVQAGLNLVPSFEGESPVPCHRDYCPANWVVSRDGVWAGVIDFEFSQWNVRATDFTRYPDWDWLARPDLVEAFFEGYGRLTPEQEQQRLVAHVRYALTAVVWGRDNAYHGFAEEGHNALKHLGKLLG